MQGKETSTSLTNMNESLIAQHLHFIEQCKTKEEIDKREFHLWRIYQDAIPKELKDAIEKQLSIINTNRNE